MKPQRAAPMRRTAKSLLLKTYPVWHYCLPNLYYPYRTDGGRIFLNIRESSMMLQRALGCYELPKHQALKYFLHDGQTFIDVGANKGDFSLLASWLVGPKGRVLSIEPHPTNCYWIKKSVEKSGYNNIDIHQLALSDSNGPAQLHLGEKSGFHTLLPGKPQRDKGEVEVQTRRLDDLLKEVRVERVDAIKIDVEGAEMHVLEGARETLSTNEGITVFLDIHPQLGVEPKEVCERLRGLGLQLFFEGAPFNVPVEDCASLRSLIGRQHAA